MAKLFKLFFWFSKVKIRIHFSCIETENLIINLMWNHKSSRRDKAILKKNEVSIKWTTLWNIETYKVTVTLCSHSMFYQNKNKQIQEIAWLTQKFRNVYTHMHTHTYIWTIIKAPVFLINNQLASYVDKNKPWLLPTH